VEDPVPPGLNAGESVAVITKSGEVVEKLAPMVVCGTGILLPSVKRSPSLGVETKPRVVGADDDAV